MDKFFFKLSDEDNVAVVRKSLKKGELGALSQIPFGHKISTSLISKDDPIIKYGQIIGYAKYDINLGEHLHTHNIKYMDVDKNYDLQSIKKYGFNQRLIRRIWNMLKNAEFKRYQSAIGPKISSMSFDKDRRFPITNKFKI